jgi:RNAse (barnase) inhibitor barstar
VKILSDLLKDPKGSGVYLLEKYSSLDDLKKLTVEQGFDFFHLEGRHIQRKDQFLKQAALVLRFPEYFGNNWDAFADCLTDMSWHETGGFVILYDQFDSLAEHSPREFKMVLDIFKESTEFWHGRGKALFVFLHGKSIQTNGLPVIYL